VSTDENKAIVRRFYAEVWDTGNMDVASEIFADDYVRHDLRPSSAAPGPEGQRRIAADFRRAFPDLTMTLDLIVAEGDLVAARWTTVGTHTGPWAGIAPTGTPVTFSGVNIFRIEGGKVVELWNHRDDLGLMEQVGAPIYAGAAPDDE
jgi:steroid delta-isomerase-like uncharacterized protein